MGKNLLLRDLVSEIAHGQVVAVVGAGVSIAATCGAPAASWTGLLATGVDRCEQLVPELPQGWGERVRGEIASGDLDDLLSAAEKVTSKLGGRRGGEYRRWLRETVGSLRQQDRAVPEALAQLGLPVVTTNYDDVLEQATGLAPVSWRDTSRVQRALRDPAEGIVHLHGHWSDPESVVLGIRSYEEILGHAPAQAVLRALTTFRSFLLVGFGKGLSDPNFVALRSWMAEVQWDGEDRHYRLVPDNEVQAVGAEHNQRERISVMGYGPQYKDLPRFIGALRAGGQGDPVVRSPTAGRATRDRVRRSAADEAAERHYREVALRTFDIINLANLPEDDRRRATRDLELRRLYVALQVEVEAPESEEMGAARLLAMEQHYAARSFQTRRGSGPARKEDVRRASIGQRLGVARQMVVLGGPGAGKSTLLRWLATAYLLRLGQDPELVELPDAQTLPDEAWLPLLIRCRDLGSTAAAGSVDEALRCSLRTLELESRQCEAVLKAARRRMVSGTALVLVDGLDEITDPTLRTRFCRQLEQFHVVHPKTPIVVTSRIVGYRELGSKIGRGFEHVTLSELTRKEKDEFARRWCALSETPERRADAEAGLIRDLHSTPRIEELTGNPMLLTTMALVRRSVGKLPNRRVSLYEKAVVVLLNWRSEVGEPLDESEALPQLHYLAYVMCDRGIQQLREDEVVGLLRELRHEYPHLRRVARREAEDFLRLLEARTDILSQAGEVRHDGRLEPVYEFRHLTFQEYLAGLALVCGHLPGAGRSLSLAERVAPLAERITVPEVAEAGVVESWREPLRLCLAACNDADADDSLLAILRPGVGEEGATTGRARAVQATRCLADEPNVSEAVADEVLRLFVHHIDARDGSSVDKTALDAAALELARSDLWIHPLERHLSTEFRNREATGRVSVARVHGLVSDVLRPEGETAEVEWIRACVTELRSPDDLTAINAALRLGRAAECYSQAIRRVPEMGTQLMAKWNDSAPLAHAAAWTLAQLGKRFYSGGWRPTTPELRRLHAYLDESRIDPGALASLASILGERHYLFAMPALTNLLRHPDASVRWEAVLALGKLGEHRVAEQLVELLGGAIPDPSGWSPWEEAGKALGQLGEHRVVPTLINRADDPDAGVRRAAVWALEAALNEIEDEGAVDFLLDVLDDTDAEVRWAAVYALGRSTDERAFGPVLELLDDPQDSVRWGAAWAMHYLGEERAIDPLLKLLHDDVSAVRWLAAWGLEGIGDERAVDGLLPLLHVSPKRERLQAAQALGELGDKRAVIPLLKLLDDVDPGVRSAAVYALVMLGDEEVLAPLLKLLDDADPNVRSAAVYALGMLGDEEVLGPLLERLGDTNPSVREFVTQALGRLGDRRALDPLLDRLGDPDGEVRSEIAKAVGNLGDARDVQPLLDLLGHADALVRPTAAAALGELGDARAVDPLLARLGDADMDLRTMVAEALGKLGAAHAGEPLLSWLDEDDAAVRRAAVVALGSLGDRRAIEPLLARLDDAVLDVRIAAAESLGKLGNRHAVAPLLECLRSRGRSFREAAAGALGRIGDPRGLEELHRLLRSTVRDTRRLALGGLSRTCTDEADRKLLSCALDGVPPFLDCRFPVDRRQVNRAVRLLRLSEEQVRHRYERLAERLPLKLDWLEA